MIINQRPNAEYSYVFEDFDKPEITDKVIEAMWRGGYAISKPPKTIEIFVFNYLSGEVVPISVNPRDYL